LCGEDSYSGENFDHRKVWVVERIKQLASVFAIDVCAYAVMSNHYHLVLHVDEKQAARWSQTEVIRRWTSLFNRNNLLLETLARNKSSSAARKRKAQLIQQWRSRLVDISWFMRCLNEHIARQANKEDGCKGRFWEGRFKSLALLDDKALVTCLAYVDLNPVRAGINNSPSSSDFTSIQKRLVNHAKRVRKKSTSEARLLRHYTSYYESKLTDKSTGFRLKPMNGGKNSLPVKQRDYFDLITWSAGQIQAQGGKPSTAKQAAVPRILSQMGIEQERWLKGVTGFGSYFCIAAGTRSSLQSFHHHRAETNLVKYPNKWIRGIRPAELLYGT